MNRGYDIWFGQAYDRFDINLYVARGPAQDMQMLTRDGDWIPVADGAVVPSLVAIPQAARAALADACVEYLQNIGHDAVGATARAVINERDWLRGLFEKGFVTVVDRLVTRP
jgi:hypothetical protein